jgi:hypothetical protein
MDLEELACFSFAGSANILAEKKLNIELRAVNLSHNMSLFTPKTEKSFENRLYLDRGSNENHRGSKDHSVSKFNSFRNESINHSIQLKPNLQKYSPSYGQGKETTGKENPEHGQQTARSDLKQEKKAISKILVSEIHFCRFLFKLLSKISESSRKGLLQQSSEEVEAIMRNYTAIIRHKIDNLTRFSSSNFIGATAYEDYKECADYAKLMKIAKEYRERYSAELKDYWGIAKAAAFSTSPTVDLIDHLYRLLHLREHTDTFIDSFSKEIVVLDYLITSKQLIELFKGGENYERFSRKSRIEEIVEGKTADISR